MRNFFTSIGRDVKIPYFSENENIAITNTRSATVGDAENTTGLYTVTFLTLSTGFTVIPSLFMNNEMSVQEDFEKKALRTAANLAKTIDEQVVTALVASATSDFEDLLNYSVSGNKIVIPKSSREIGMTDMEIIMNANGFDGPFFYYRKCWCNVYGEVLRTVFYI